MEWTLIQLLRHLKHSEYFKESVSIAWSPNLVTVIALCMGQASCLFTCISQKSHACHFQRHSATETSYKQKAHSLEIALVLYIHYIFLSFPISFYFIVFEWIPRNSLLFFLTICNLKAFTSCLAMFGKS